MPNRCGGTPAWTRRSRDEDELDRAAARVGARSGTPGSRRTARSLDGTRGRPQLGAERPCFICDYPASQASLARLKPGIPPVAARFELYLDGVEIANGFHELVECARTTRLASAGSRDPPRAQPAEPPMDERLLAALGAGMPDCAGVALGSIGWSPWRSAPNPLLAGMAFPIENA